MTIDEMKENGSKHWKQQALIQVLRVEFEEWLDNESKYLIEDTEGNIINITKKLRTAYFDAAEPREEKISALEALVKKMKCCANCENYCQRIDHRCNTECKNHSLWKLNEDFGWRTESN